MPPVTETNQEPQTAEPEQLTLGEQTPAPPPDVFKEAESLLEVDESEPTPKPPPATPEEELAIPEEEKEKTPPVEAKPNEEPPPEKKKSKRELFKEKADAERDYRDKEKTLKEREAKLQANQERVEAILRELEADPYAYLEKKDPRFFEKLVDRNLEGKRTPESAELAALKAEIAQLREETKTKHEETVNQVQQAQYVQYMNDAKGILGKPEFQDAQEDSEIWQKFTGQPVDVERAIASVYAEYKTNYNKELTPAECCEIINEDAQAHLENIGSFIEYMAEKKPDIFKQSKTVAKIFGQTPTYKKTEPPQTPATLTNVQETQSVPAGEIDPSKYPTKEAYLDAVANATLEFEQD